MASMTIVLKTEFEKQNLYKIWILLYNDIEILYVSKKKIDFVYLHQMLYLIVPYFFLDIHVYIHTFVG